MEIGPGLGHLAKILQKDNDYFAADLVPHYLTELGLKPGRSLLWDVTHGGVKEEFDLIVACDVFEHVLNEGDAWLSVFEALKPGGIFFIRIPYKEPLVSYSRLLGAPYPYVHLRSYTLGYLREMSQHSGFTIKRISRTYNHQAPYARRDFGLPFLKKSRSKEFVSWLKLSYSNKEMDSKISRTDVSKVRTFTLSSVLKLVFNRFGPGVQSILRNAYNSVLKSTACCLFRPAEIALVLHKSSSPKRLRP